MNKNKFILSVLPSSAPRNYLQPKYSKKEFLEKSLKERGIELKLGEILKGGVVSQVYSATLNGKKVAVKHTEDVNPFDPTEFMIKKEGHNMDTKILKLLQNSKSVKVPRIIAFFPEITTTIMEDVRDSGFQLLNDLIMKKKLEIQSASKIGEMFANLSLECHKWKEFKTNESAEQNIYERGLELRLSYPNSQVEYLALEKEYVSNNKYFLWPDGHPKNIFVNEQGNPIFIDFGRSHWGDQRFMLPNFLAHIVIYTLVGYIRKPDAREYIENCIKAYERICGAIDKNVFCKYLAMEVLHRMNGKWVQGISTSEQKISLFKFGLSIFDGNISSVKRMLSLL